MTTLISAIDTDIIIQIPVVFVKATKEKSQNNGKICINVPAETCFAHEMSVLRSHAPSISPSTIGTKGAVVNVKKRREYLQEKRWALGRPLPQEDEPVTRGSIAQGSS